jgi:hypothetical protein
MKYLFYTLCFFSITGSCLAQSIKPEIIATSGNFFKNANNSISWTLGECVTETFKATGNILTQGFQQSSYVVTSINELTIEGFSVKAYPNPVSDVINISIKTGNNSPKTYRVELFDFLGRTLYSGKFGKDLIQLDMSSYTSGFYLLKVGTPENKISQNFKLQKIN